MERFYDVDLNVYNPERKNWTYRPNMVVLIKEDYIYAVKAEAYFNECSSIMESNSYLTLTQDAKKKYARNITTELLNQCRITQSLQGEIYSKNSIWKISRPIQPIDFQTQFKGTYSFLDKEYKE